MDVEETRVDWGGLAPCCCVPWWGSEGWEADSPLASWLRLPMGREWVLLCVTGLCAGLGNCCWVRESWDPEAGPARPLDPYWKDRPPNANGLWTRGLHSMGAKGAEARSWECSGEEEEAGVDTPSVTWSLLSIPEVSWTGGQKLMATACCKEAMAELCVGPAGGGVLPSSGGVRDVARARGTSTCWTISRSYLTISWIISFSRLLKTPELRSC